MRYRGWYIDVQAIGIHHPTSNLADNKASTDIRE